jgi:C1A family cysteine protease
MQRRKYNVKIERVKSECLHLLSLEKRLPGRMLPRIVDLRTNSKMPSVYDQEDIGSCTAQAFCAAYQFLDNNSFMGSRLFLYYNERKLENNIPDDSGATLESGISCLTKYGLCPESEWPYDTKKFSVKPPDSCYTSALKEKLLKFKNINNDRNTMRNFLNLGIPLVVGIAIYPSFESRAVEQTGIVPMPAKNGVMLGGHAVLVVGFNHKKGQWIVRNSWGTNWGDKGYFYLPYNYLLNRRLCTDIWVLTKVTD